MSAAAISVENDPVYGVIFVVRGKDVADEFEDFLAEVVDLDFFIMLRPDGASLYPKNKVDRYEAERLARIFGKTRLGA